MTKNISLRPVENSTYHIPERVPARIMEIELGQPLPTLEAFDEKTEQWYQRAFCVIRLHTQPLGKIEILFIEDRLVPEQYVQSIWEALHAEIVDHVRQDGLPAPSGLEASGLPYAGIPHCIEVREKFYAEAPFVSVIVSTRDRPDHIQRCVQSLLCLHYPRYEIIVVDNAPSTDATADIIQQIYHDVPQIHYVREDHPGLSSARNRGLTIARGEILAFADDDLVIDPYWLISLVQAFGLASNVACVTGLILPLELETPPQFWFEEFGGVGKGFTRRIFDRDGNYSRQPLYPYTAGQFGSGASIAFTKKFLRWAGGFDPALGTGSPARGGEDLAIFFQAVTGGHKIVYEPASLVYHPHYREYKDLSKQIYGYGVGLGAYLMKTVWDNPRLLLDVAMKIPYGLFFLLSTRSPKNSKKSTSFPGELTVIEHQGLLHGPFAYLKSRREIRKRKEMDRRMLVDKQKTAVDTVQYEDFMPIRIAEIELGQPLSTVQALDDRTGQYYRRARCLVRLHGQPLGLVELQLDEQGVSAREYAPHIWHVLSKKINEHLLLDGLPPVTELDEKGLLSLDTLQCIEMRERFLEDAPFVSVIVATHDRSSQLVKCLHSLLALQYARYEIIVVDNTPSTTATAELVQDICSDNPHVRYVREERLGSSWARNCGITTAQGEILAFTDDDVVVDRYWLVELIRAFNVAADVACVTGLILPLELETPSQFWFEERIYPARFQYDGFCPGFAQRIFDMRKNNANMPLHPYIAGRFGAGASMAFTKVFLDSISGFDPVLGPGSPTQGGEDHAAFLQAITRGYKLVYEPAALVYHSHRRDYKSLYKQIYGYGTGFTAYIMKCLLADYRLIFDIVTKLPYAFFFVLSRKSAQNHQQLINYPKELNQAEMKGRLHGPLTYVQSLWALRSMCKVKK